MSENLSEIHNLARAVIPFKTNTDFQINKWNKIIFNVFESTSTLYEKEYSTLFSCVVNQRKYNHRHWTIMIKRYIKFLNKNKFTFIFRISCISAPVDKLKIEYVCYDYNISIWIELLNNKMNHLSVWLVRSPNPSSAMIGKRLKTLSLSEHNSINNQPLGLLGLCRKIYRHFPLAMTIADYRIFWWFFRGFFLGGGFCFFWTRSLTSSWF